MRKTKWEKETNSYRGREKKTNVLGFWMWSWRGMMMSMIHEYRTILQFTFELQLEEVR